MNPPSRRSRSNRDGRRAGESRVHAEHGRRSRGIEPSSLVVRRTLASYAKRGIFRAWGDRPSDRERSRFSFRWHADATFHIVYDPSRRELTFCDLLPDVGSHSLMYRELKQFLHSRTSLTLPEHRRVDPRKVGVTLKSRKRMMSLVVSLKDPHLEYGVRKAVNLVHELFVDFLRHPLYFPYMVEHFNVDPEL
jgi:hypothetical protein